MEPRKKKPKRGYSASMDGAALVLSHDAVVPAVCMKCGSHDQITRREVVFSWSPAWVRYLVFCLIGIILRVLMQVRASFVVPLCARCNSRWAAARIAGIGSLVILSAALASGPLLRHYPQARFIGVAAFVLFAAVHLVFVRPRVLPVHRIDEETIAFDKVNAEATKEILEGARP